MFMIIIIIIVIRSSHRIDSYAAGAHSLKSLASRLLKSRICNLLESIHLC